MESNKVKVDFGDPSEYFRAFNESMKGLQEKIMRLNDKFTRNSYELVREFMETFGHPVYTAPTEIEDEAWLHMRLELIREELGELYEACGYDTAEWDEVVPTRQMNTTDVVAAADALGDLEYVVNGMALGMGIPLPEVVAEIHRSNMTKLGPDGKPIYREDGKILKGEDYEQPDLKRVLGL